MRSSANNILGHETAEVDSRCSPAGACDRISAEHNRHSVDIYAEYPPYFSARSVMSVVEAYSAISLPQLSMNRTNEDLLHARPVSFRRARQRWRWEATRRISQSGSLLHCPKQRHEHLRDECGVRGILGFNDRGFRLRRVCLSEQGAPCHLS